MTFKNLFKWWKPIYYVYLAYFFSWWLLRDSMGTMDDFLKGDYVFIVIGLCYIAGRNVIRIMQLETPHFVSPTIWDSFSVRPEFKSAWVIVRLGGVRIFGIKGNKVAILPTKYLKVNGNTLYTKVRLEKITSNFQVPTVCQPYLKQHGLVNKEIFVGRNEYDNEIADPELMIETLEKNAEFIKENFIYSLFEEGLKSVDKQAQVSEEMMKRFNQKGIMDMVNELKKSKEDE